MADEAYPTSKQGPRQLASMDAEEKKRYDAALKARQEEAGRESIGSVKRRYGLSPKNIEAPILPQPVDGSKGPGNTSIPETPTTNALSTELAENYKLFHSAPPGPLKEHFASEIAKLETKIGSASALLEQSENLRDLAL